VKLSETVLSYQRLELQRKSVSLSAALMFEDDDDDEVSICQTPNASNPPLQFGFHPVTTAG